MERGFPYAIGANQGTLERGYPVFIAEIFQTTITDAGGIATAEAFGTPTVAAATFITGAGGIGTAEAFGWASVSDADGQGIWLGPAGLEVRLPRMRWLDRDAPGIPATYAGKVDKSRMLSGRTRFNVRPKEARKWALAWEALTTAELNVLLDFQEQNTLLHFQNNWANAEWSWVVIKDMAVYPDLKCGAPAVGRYRVEVVLEEAL